MRSYWTSAFAVCTSVFIVAGGLWLQNVAGEEIPVGFGVERYARLLEHNPFAPVTLMVQQTKPSPLDNLVLVSWLNDGFREIIFVENSGTREVQQITSQPGLNNLRLIGLHLDPNPELVEAIISDGMRQVGLKFRFDTRPLAGQADTSAASNGEGAASGAKERPQPSVQTANKSMNQPLSQVSALRIYPGMPRVHSEGEPVAKETPASWARRKRLYQGNLPAQSNLGQN